MVSSDVDLNDAKACYKSLSSDSVSIALGRNAIFSNLPKYLVIKVVAEWFTISAPSDFDSTTYYMELSSSECTSTFEFHSPKDFTFMKLKMDFHTGYNINPFTIIEAEVFPETKDGLHFFVDIYGMLGLYATYKYGDDRIIKHGIPLSFNDFSSKLDTGSFTSKFICVADQHQMYVLEPVFHSTRHSPSQYQAIVFRYYLANTQQTMAVVPAWPCDSDPLGSSSKIRYALIGYSLDGQVHISYEMMTRHRRFPKIYKLSNLLQKISFVTPDTEVLSLHHEDGTKIEDNLVYPFNKITRESECGTFDVQAYTVYSHGYPVISYMKTFDGVNRGFKNFHYEALPEIISCK